MAEHRIEADCASFIESWCSSGSVSGSHKVDLKDVEAVGAAFKQHRAIKALRRSATCESTTDSFMQRSTDESEQDDDGAPVFFKWMNARGETGRCPKTTEDESSAYTEDQQQALADEAMKRAGEMCIWMQLKSLARRQQLRYPGAGVHSVARADSEESDAGEALSAQQQPPGSDPDRRRALGREANRFDQAYAEVQETIRGRLSFKAPVRSHTVAIGEVTRALAAEHAGQPVET